MNSHVSEPLSNRTGNFSLNTTSGAMANLLNQFSDETANPSPKISSPRISLSIITTASTSAKSADRPSRLVCPHCGHSLFRKKQYKQFILHKCINPIGEDGFGQSSKMGQGTDPLRVLRAAL